MFAATAARQCGSVCSALRTAARPRVPALGFTAFARRGLAQRVYVEGQGYLGCLGTGAYDELTSTIPVPSLRGTDVTSVAAGWGHSAATSASGELFVWGRTHDVSNTLRFIWLQGMFPRLVAFMNRVSGGSMLASLEPAVNPFPGSDDVRFVKAACSVGAITVGITDEGHVYAVGSNTFGECGVGHTENNVWDWERVKGLDDAHIVDVRLGFAHAVALAADGRAFTWGKGERGQVGLGDTYWYKAAVPLAGRNEELRHEKITCIGAGFNHGVVVTDDGRPFLWGKMQSREVDEQGLHQDELWPVHIPVDGKVVQVACGQAHTCFLTEEGRLFLIGMRGRGELNDRSVDAAGVADLPMEPRLSSAVILDPVEVPLGPLEGKRIVQLEADTHHTYAVTDSGEVYWWGWRLQVGLHNPAAGLKVTQIARGLVHTLFLCDDA